MGNLGSIINYVTRHRVSANVLMLVFILAGAWAISKLNTRFFPEFTTNRISTTVSYSGADSAEVEETVVIPLENALRSISNIEEMYAYAREGSGVVYLEFPEGADMEKALSDIKSEVERLNLPVDADAPRTRLHTREEDVGSFTIATDNKDELRDLARRLETDFNSRGIAKLNVVGIPEEEINIAIDQYRLIELGLTLAQVGQALRAQNLDISAGSVQGIGNERKIRANSKTADINELYKLPISTNNLGETTYLRDIASIRREISDDQVEIRYNSRPAVRFEIINAGTNDIIATANKVYDWIATVRPTIPSTVDLVMHDERWLAVDSRLKLLVKNGLSGLVIVISLLYLFLSSQVALWVAIGIPVAMLGTLFVFNLVGGTINMISMFALIMAVGIIVDDSIVVGENAQYRINNKQPPMRAVVSAAKNMFTPVFASSFTTIASFMPLFLIGGTIGKIIFDIPLIIICILIAALIECFLILPGHLYQSFAKKSLDQPGFIRRKLDGGFNIFREKIFRPISNFSVNNALAVIAACFVILFISFMLIRFGFVKYRFFPGAEGNRVTSSIEFNVGTPRTEMESYVNQMVATLNQVAEREGKGEKLVKHVSALYGYGGSTGNADSRAQIQVELVEPDDREITTQQFSAKWRRALGAIPPGIEKITMRGGRSGPPGQDVEINITGAEIDNLKAASIELQDVLDDIPGLSSVTDDTPYGEDQIIFSLTPLGKSLNLNIDTVGRQIRNAIDGFIVQRFTEGLDEVDLKVLFNQEGQSVINDLYLRLQNGEYVLISDLVTWSEEKSFATILHNWGQAAVKVSADLDDDANTNVGDILAVLEAEHLPSITSKYGINYSFEGRQSQHNEAVKDMAIGLGITVLLIFIILTAVFNSWSLPIVVMLAMPLGVIGTVFGHLFMGLTMSILSFFGMFTLMGIIVNNAIVLVRCFQDLGVNIENAKAYNDAIVEASCLRLRAVLLTSLTTIGGLTPLMFETSLQAQFLIPMAASIVFGLAFATVIILFFTPACMSLHGSISRVFIKIFGSNKRKLKLATSISS